MIHHRTPRRGLFVLFLMLVPPARAEDKHPVKILGESAATALRLAEARKQLGERKWSEAIEQLQTILNTAGNDLVSVKDDHAIQAGHLCRIQLALLPAEALRLYRQRYEDQARAKLQQAQAERDVPQLRKIAEDAFCTRAAEKAMDLLGDLAFERGRFEEAEQWWRLLAPLPDGRREVTPRDLALVYPDLSLDPARIQAKQLLARLFQEADSDGKKALDAYRQRHAKAEGTLAGRKGRYVDLLHELADQRKNQRNAHGEDWPTFGGDFSRGRVISASDDILDRLSALCRDGPTWSIPLEPEVRQEDATPAPAVNAAQARRLAFHPILVGHQLFVADAQVVTTIDLRNGQKTKWDITDEKFGGVHPNLRLPAPPDLRYTLTAADDHVYARLGAQDLGLKAPGPKRPGGLPPAPQDNETFLACLRSRTEDGSSPFRWGIRGISHDNALLEGAPIVADGLIWIASTRYQSNNCQTSIDCYPVHDPAEPPLRWRCDLCTTNQPRAGEPRYRHHLLTRAGTQIVYCTHSGAIFAVDALTGRRNWAIRYPRRTLESKEVDLHGLAPVLFAAGRLFVAPADSDTLLCLDPSTGHILWEVEPLQVVHLLGVGQGRLIFTTPNGLRAVQVDNGNPAWSVPDTGGGLTPSGRGLLIGDLVLFPTTQLRDPGSPTLQTVVYAIRQSDGRPADDPAKLHRLPGGNLAYANGCLAVADQRTLSVFVPPRMLLSKRQAQAQRQPDSAAALLELAQAQADAGQREDALRTFRRAESSCHNLLPSQRKSLLARLRSEKQRLLLEMAGHAARAQRRQDAERALQEALAVPLGPRGRLHALLRAAHIWQEVGDMDRAHSVWHAIRDDEQLRQIQVIDHSGNPMPAADCAAINSGSNRGERGRVSAPSGGRKPPESSLYSGGLRPPLGALMQPRSPLLRTWEVRLERDEWMLDGWHQCDPELLLTGTSKNRFVCRFASTGEIRWQVRLPFAPSWAGCCRETILVGGAEGVSCLHRDNGQLLWHFPAPVTDRYPRAGGMEVRVVLDPQPPEPLTAFQLAGGRLYFLQGQRLLFALNADTGTALWQHEAPDSRLHLPFPRGRFSSCYHAGAETVLVQAPGRRWLLDAATGRTLHQAADSRDLWQRPPLALDERTWCVIPDNRHIVALDARTGQYLWKHQSPGGTTLSGELPSVLGRDKVLLFVQPANIGYYLDRLDRSTGQSVWSRPQLLAAMTVDRNSWAFDTDAVYSIEDGVLLARSLADGTVIWRRTLPSFRGQFFSSDVWEVRRGGDFLAVSPCDSVEARFRFRSPLGPLQWDWGLPAFPDPIFPVSFYDPKTGQLVQRLNLRIESPMRTTLAKGKAPEEGSPTWRVRTSSLSASADGPVIRLDAPHPFVAVGGEVWGLTSFRREP